MAKYSRMRMEANKKTNIGQTLHIICRFRRTQAASSAIYIMDIAFNKAKLTSSNDIMFISSPNKLNVFSIQNFKYTFKTVFCVSNRSFLKATIRFLFHFFPYKLNLIFLYPQHHKTHKHTVQLSNLKQNENHPYNDLYLRKTKIELS